MYKFIIILSLSLVSIGSFAQSKFTISGTIKDAKNGETLIGAGVTIKEKNVSVVSNVFGFYSITEPEGTYTIVINYIGYKPYSNQIKLDKNIILNIELEESSKELSTVEIKAESSADNVRKIEMSVAKLDIKQINKIPALLGEVDIVRAIQLLPGVSTVGEGATGFNVRGGSIDQNLILLDDAPVYNSAHLFGFFSVFNPDAVKDVKLIKAGIPSQYGGRLSSILDVRNKDGNNKNYQVNG
ncbi:MAG: carboxypeptidase-like regulatory domain-containing protein, partial [Bacteroidota bacterium]